MTLPEHTMKQLCLYGQWNVATKWSNETRCQIRYIDLPIGRRSSVQYLPSSRIFRFEDGNTLQAKKCAKLPACIGEKQVVINGNVVEESRPMLLSKPAMKKAGTCQASWDLC